MNKVIILGRLVRDPETKETQSGVKFTKITIAVNNQFKKDEVDFIPVIAWRQQAEFIEKYIRKGQRISVVGRFASSQYEKDGEKRTNYNVVAESVQSIDTKKESEQLNDNNIVSPPTKKVETTEQKQNSEIPWELDL